GKAPTDLEQASPDGIETAPLDPATIDGMALSNHTLVGTSQSTGVERAHNEDALFSMLASSAGENAVPDFGLYVVADGMGGHRSGEVAASLSVRSVAHRLSADPLMQLFDLNGSADSRPLQDLVRQALQEANKSVVNRVPGGGTTLTVALVLGNQMTIGHVGDSRAYILTQGEPQVITRDHSLVNRLVELGQLTEAEAAVHPQRNVLYKAIGQGANLEVDVETFPIPKNGFLFICSDGLWGVVPDEEIQRIAWGADHPQAACDELVRAANAAGGPDNITAVLVYFPPA
ncbi:MAG: PP2C family protein-serine/threonine phosphatase, partial [Anaerolineales bacterium]